MKAILSAALVAGVFCAGFAVIVDILSSQLNLFQTIAIAALSGFLGALVGQLFVRSQK
jgi:hypothetical protein